MLDVGPQLVATPNRKWLMMFGTKPAVRRVTPDSSVNSLNPHSARYIRSNRRGAATTSDGKPNAKHSLSTHSEEDILVVRKCGAQKAVVHTGNSGIRGRHTLNHDIGLSNKRRPNTTVSKVLLK